MYHNNLTDLIHFHFHKIFRTDVVKIITIINKRVRKLSMSTQLCATWHTDSLDM
jgi:hypothetical protein